MARQRIAVWGLRSAVFTGVLALLVANARPGAGAELGFKGDCGQESPEAGCSNAACEACVCAIDEECCIADPSPGGWDTGCVILAASDACSSACLSGSFIGDCGVEAVERPPGSDLEGCSDPECETCVCDRDAKCCAFDSWDSLCVIEAAGAGESPCAADCLVSPSRRAPTLAWPSLAGLLIALASLGAYRLRRTRRAAAF